MFQSRPGLHQSHGNEMEKSRGFRRATGKMYRAYTGRLADKGYFSLLCKTIHIVIY